MNRDNDDTITSTETTHWKNTSDQNWLPLETDEEIQLKSQTCKENRSIGEDDNKTKCNTRNEGQEVKPVHCDQNQDQILSELINDEQLISKNSKQDRNNSKETIYSKPGVQQADSSADIQQASNCTNVQQAGNSTKVQHAITRIDVQLAGKSTDVQQASNSTDVQQAGNSTDIQQTGNSTDYLQTGNSADVQQAGNSTDVQQAGNSTDVQQADNSTDVQQAGNSIDLQQADNSNDVQQAGNITDVEQAGNSSDVQQANTKVGNIQQQSFQSQTLQQQQNDGNHLQSSSNQQEPTNAIDFQEQLVNTNSIRQQLLDNTNIQHNDNTNTKQQPIGNSDILEQSSYTSNTIQQSSDQNDTHQQPGDNSDNQQQPNDKNYTKQQSNDENCTPQQPRDERIAQQQPNDSSNAKQQPSNNKKIQQQPNDNNKIQQHPTHNIDIDIEQPSCRINDIKQLKNTVKDGQKTMQTGFRNSDILKETIEKDNEKLEIITMDEHQRNKRNTQQQLDEQQTYIKNIQQDGLTSVQHDDTNDSQQQFHTNEQPCDTENNRPECHTSEPPFDMMNNKTKCHTSEQPCDTEDNKPQCHTSEPPFDTKNNKPQCHTCEQPCDTEDNKPQCHTNEQPCDTEDNKPQCHTNEQPCDTENNRPECHTSEPQFDMMNNKTKCHTSEQPCDTEDNKPQCHTSEPPFDTKNNKPQCHTCEQTCDTENNKPQCHTSEPPCDTKHKPQCHANEQPCDTENNKPQCHTSEQPCDTKNNKPHCHTSEQPCDTKNNKTQCQTNEQPCDTKNNKPQSHTIGQPCDVKNNRQHCYTAEQLCNDKNNKAQFHTLEQPSDTKDNQQQCHSTKHPFDAKNNQQQCHTAEQPCNEKNNKAQCHTLEQPSDTKDNQQQCHSTKHPFDAKNNQQQCHTAEQPCNEKNNKAQCHTLEQPSDTKDNQQQCHSTKHSFDAKNNQQQCHTAEQPCNDKNNKAQCHTLEQPSDTKDNQQQCHSTKHPFDAKNNQQQCHTAEQPCNEKNNKAQCHTLEQPSDTKDNQQQCHSTKHSFDAKNNQQQCHTTEQPCNDKNNKAQCHTLEQRSDTKDSQHQCFVREEKSDNQQLSQTSKAGDSRNSQLQCSPKKQLNDSKDSMQQTSFTEKHSTLLGKLNARAKDNIKSFKDVEQHMEDPNQTDFKVIEEYYNSTQELPIDLSNPNKKSNSNIGFLLAPKQVKKQTESMASSIHSHSNNPDDRMQQSQDAKSYLKNIIHHSIMKDGLQSITIPNSKKSDNLLHIPKSKPRRNRQKYCDIRDMQELYKTYQQEDTSDFHEFNLQGKDVHNLYSPDEQLGKIQENQQQKTSVGDYCVMRQLSHPSKQEVVMDTEYGGSSSLQSESSENRLQIVTYQRQQSESSENGLQIIIDHSAGIEQSESTSSEHSLQIATDHTEFEKAGFPVKLEIDEQVTDESEIELPTNQQSEHGTEGGIQDDIAHKENKNILFVCNTCLREKITTATFSNGQTLARHAILVHHPLPNLTGPYFQFTCHTEDFNYYCIPVVQEKLYPCKFGNCTETFTCARLLRNHVSEHHTKKQLVFDYKKCQYRHCERLFSSQESRKQHVREFHIDHSIKREDGYGALWIIKSSPNDKFGNKQGMHKNERIHENCFQEIRNFFVEVYEVTRIIVSSGDYFVSFCENCAYYDAPRDFDILKYGKLCKDEKQCDVSYVCREIKSAYGDFIVDINNVKSRMLNSGVLFHDFHFGCCIFIDDVETRSEIKEDNGEKSIDSEIDIPILKKIKPTRNELQKSITENIKPKDVEADIGDLVFLYGKPNPNYSPACPDTVEDNLDSPEGEIIYHDENDQDNYAVLSCDAFPSELNTSAEPAKEDIDRKSVIKVESYWEEFGDDSIKRSLNISTDDQTVNRSMKPEPINEEMVLTENVKQEKVNSGKTKTDKISSAKSSKNGGSKNMKKPSQTEENKVHTWKEEEIGSCISIPDSHLVTSDFLSEISENFIDSGLNVVEDMYSKIQKSSDVICDTLEGGSTSIKKDPESQKGLNKDSKSQKCFIEDSKSQKCLNIPSSGSSAFKRSFSVPPGDKSVKQREKKQKINDKQNKFASKCSSSSEQKSVKEEKKETFSKKPYGSLLNIEGNKTNKNAKTLAVLYMKMLLKLKWTKVEEISLKGCC